MLICDLATVGSILILDVDFRLKFHILDTNLLPTFTTIAFSVLG